MANLTITSVPGKSKILMTSNNVDAGWDTCYFWKEDIFHIHEEGNHVELKWINGETRDMSFDGAEGTWKVDSVLGTTITGNTQLASLLSDIRG